MANVETKTWSQDLNSQKVTLIEELCIEWDCLNKVGTLILYFHKLQTCIQSFKFVNSCYLYNNPDNALNRHHHHRHAAVFRWHARSIPASIETVSLENIQYSCSVSNWWLYVSVRSGLVFVSRPTSSRRQVDIDSVGRSLSEHCEIYAKFIPNLKGLL